MTDNPIPSINNIAVVLNNAMDFEASLNTTTTARSLDSTPSAFTTTAATTTPATTTLATTAAVTTYTPSSDISTIVSDPSPVTLSSEKLSHLSREFFANWPVGSLQEPVEIAARVLAPKVKWISNTRSMISLVTLPMLPTPRSLGCRTSQRETRQEEVDIQAIQWLP